MEKEIPQLEEIAGKTWKKEEELKGLKAELAALDRKIQLVWQKYTNGHGFTFLYKECKSWFETVHTRGTNENTICLCRKGIYELMVESSSTTMALI